MRNSYAELSLVVKGSGSHDHAGREQDQGLETPAIERKTLDKRPVNHRADRRRGIHRGDATFHRDALRRGANGHLEVDCESILNMQNHMWLDQLFEAGLFDFDLIEARGKIGQVVFAGRVGRGLIPDIRASADGGDFRIGDQAFGGIGDAAREGGICGLGAKDREIGNEEEDDESGDPAHGVVNRS